MSKKGFTLIETLLALVILSSGILLIANSWSGARGRISKTQLNVELGALLERKMVEVQLEYNNKPLESIPETKEDTFGSEYPNYKWKIQSKELEIPDLAPMMMSKDGGANENFMQIIKQLTDHLQKVIKEVKVTVIYSGGKKPIEVSATSYFVDFTKQIGPGGTQ